MDHTDSIGDDDGCGSINSGFLTAGSTTSYPATVATGVTLPAGSTVSGTLYLATDAPGPVDVSLALKRGADSVGSGSTSFVSFGAQGLVDFVASGLSSQYAAVPFTFTTSTDIAASDVLTFDVTISGTPSYYYGYEGVNASRFTIHHD